ncbi:MAG: flagellar hook-length control protein FliK [Alphaproteobacteria bacterium]|nr:flagellar hook-length control protein FliK [Alphaproteobacteria bacterium]
MNTNALLITQIATPPSAAGKNGPTGGGNMAQGLSGVSFIDLIFAQITASTKDSASSPQMSLTASSIELKRQESIAGSDESAILESLLAQLDTDSSALLNAGTIDVSLPQPITPISDPTLDSAVTKNIIADNPNSFSGIGSLRSYLDSLLQGLPQEQRPGQNLTLSPEAKAGFKDFMAQLKNHLSSHKADGEASLIATGLSPEDMTVLMQATDNGQIPSDQLMVNLVAPVSATEQLAILLPRALIAIQEQSQKSKDFPAQESSILTDDETAAALNALVIGNSADLGGHTEANPKKPSIDTVALLPGGVSADAEHAAGKGLSQALEQLNENMEKATADGKKIPAGLQNAAEKIQNKIGAGLSTVTQPVSGSIEATNNWQEVFPEGIDPASPYAAALKPGGMNATTTLTSLIHNAPHASNPHPATQSVAATISKLASNGEDKAFTIKLDPPELGRVEIKMMIDKNNAVKAHLVIEKPETFMMLQRDAQVLERSLQGIGLDTGDGGLSFELAQDNMFQNEGDRGGERYQSGNKTTGDTDSAETLMETTMTWHVDPDTGMQRYNILA